MNEEDYYSESDKKRMRYYLKEMEGKFSRCPNSLMLRNGITRVRKILNLTPTVTSIDPLTTLSDITSDSSFHHPYNNTTCYEDSNDK